MNIIVFDVAAEYGGALTILNEYYTKALKDKNNKWYFIVSTNNLIDCDNITVVKFSWIKKSWFHRLVFDLFVARKLVIKYNADEVISLQNIFIHGVKQKQTLYLHQPLPFVEKRYKINENYIFWLYQNVISRMIFSSIKKAEHIIVQTNWMKEACIKKTKVNSNKLQVIPPNPQIMVKSKFKKQDDKVKLFFYPANSAQYKNHKIILDAAYLLKQQQIENFRVVFTLQGNENSNAIKIYNEVEDKKLPIDFIGMIKQEDVYDYYSKSILIFPSYIETFGLPMLEASMHETPILASDCAFSHEILDEYNKVRFFNPYNANELKDEMCNFLMNQFSKAVR